MNYNLVLPLLALVLTILAALIPSRPKDEPTAPLSGMRAGSVLAAIIVALFTLASLWWPGILTSGTWVALALAIGALASASAARFEATRPALPMSLAVLGASLAHFAPAGSIASTQLAFVVGAGVVAFATSFPSFSANGGPICALAGLAVVGCDFLGREAVGSEPASNTGIVLGLGYLIAAIVSGVVGQRGSGFVRGGLGFIVLLAVGFLTCWKFLGDNQLGLLWVGGVVVGGIVHLLFAGEGEPDSFRFILAVVIWLGAATVAFSLGLGHGMAVMILGGVSMLALTGNTRALLSTCVVLAVLTYRLFREAHPEGARALDIGQHYTMIGIALGALVPLLPIEWGRSRTWSSVSGFLGSFLWLLILLGLPVAAAVLLGSKGAIGMVIGFSFASVVDGLRGSRALASGGLSVGLGALTALSYAWLHGWMDLERAAKQHALIYVAGVIVVVAALLFVLSRQATTAEPQ